MEKVSEVLIMTLLVIFGIDKSLSSHIDNQKNNFLVLGEGPTEGINGTVSTAGKKIVLSFVEKIQNFA